MEPSSGGGTAGTPCTACEVADFAISSTSTDDYFREVGATLGVAVFGTVFTNRMVARGEAVAGDDVERDDDVREATPAG